VRPVADLSRPLEAVREACARVAAGAESVRVDAAALRRFAAGVPVAELGEPSLAGYPDLGADAERAAAWVFALDAINFGSGWFPLLAKRPGHSGYRHVEACLRERFERAGAPSPTELRRASPASCAALFEQPADTPAAELLALFARAWSDLGAWVEERHGGSFLCAARAAGGSAERLVAALLEMPLYRDVATWRDLAVPFLKRAQITAWDLARSVPDPAVRFGDLPRLTLFADNLVPHVLRLDGVLRFDPVLEARIEREELLASGSPEEVEIRACAVHAVELLVELLRVGGAATCPAELDQWLWLRGGAPRYKARPRHRTRCPYY
jgi:hypothetical protein